MTGTIRAHRWIRMEAGHKKACLPLVKQCHDDVTDLSRYKRVVTGALLHADCHVQL